MLPFVSIDKVPCEDSRQSWTSYNFVRIENNEWMAGMWSVLSRSFDGALSRISFNSKNIESYTILWNLAGVPCRVPLFLQSQPRFKNDTRSPAFFGRVGWYSYVDMLDKAKECRVSLSNNASSYNHHLLFAVELLSSCRENRTATRQANLIDSFPAMRVNEEGKNNKDHNNNLLLITAPSKSFRILL